MTPSATADLRAPGQRRLALWSAICASGAVVASIGWGSAMEVIANMTRPPQLDGIPAYPAYSDIAPLQHDAELHMWMALIPSFLAIIALAAVAIVLGRKARRLAQGSAHGVHGVHEERLAKWGVASLALSLLSISAYYPIERWTTIITPNVFDIFVAVMAMGAIGGFILSGIATRRGTRAAGHQVAGQGSGWRFATRATLAASALVIALWFLIEAFYSLFTVAFYMHLVW